MPEFSRRLDGHLDVHPVDESSWNDLVRLFGPSGTQRGCWCMAWRLSSRDFEANGNAENRAALHAAVRAGAPVGLLGYLDRQPVAWCAVAPRSAYVRILRSRHLAPDPATEPDEVVWSVPCIFIRGGLRGRGMAGQMLAAAVEHVRGLDVPVIEGYPVDTEGGTRSGDIHSGTIGLFERTGFVVHRRPPGGRRVVMRRRLVDTRRSARRG